MLAAILSWPKGSAIRSHPFSAMSSFSVLGSRLFTSLRTLRRSDRGPYTPRLCGTAEGRGAGQAGCGPPLLVQVSHSFLKMSTCNPLLGQGSPLLGQGTPGLGQSSLGTRSSLAQCCQLLAADLLHLCHTQLAKE